MSIDIDVDEKELAEFIEVLSKFETLTKDKLDAVDTAWTKCNESWKGESKDKFTQDFEATKDRVEKALEAGEDSLVWLREYDERIKQFEQGY